MSEVVLILAVGTAVLAILFGGRVAVRTVAGGATQQSEHASGQHPGWVGLGQAAWAAAVTVRRCQGSSSVMRLAG